MIITDLRMTPVAIPLKASCIPYHAQGKPHLAEAVLVEIFTDEGLIGVGECPCLPGRDLASGIVRDVKPALIGKDPRNICGLLKGAHIKNQFQNPLCRPNSMALIGIEMALWDLLGKRAGLPLYKLLGGAFRKRVEFAAKVVRQDLKGMAKRAADFVSRGYNVIYTDAGIDPAEDVAAVAAMREGAPCPSTRLRVDANQAWSTDTAIKTINRMAEYGVELVDRPVNMRNINDIQDVRDSVSVPISGHGSSWTMRDVLNIVMKGALDYLSLDAGFGMGYSGLRMGSGIAEAAGIQCVFRSNLSLGVSFAMNLHMIASTPNITLANIGSVYDDLDDDVLSGGKLPSEGPYYYVPEGPGIGVGLDMGRVSKYNQLYVREALG